jgi:hypothetical protein
MKKFVYSIFACMILLATASCGYKFGSLMHPQIKSIAIGDITNDTAAYNVSYQLKQLLAEEFMTDGSVELANRRVADAIVFARIISVGFSEVTGRDWGDGIYHPIEWKARVVIEFSAVVPGEKTPLASGQVEGIAYFKAQADPDVMRQRATMMACRDAAQKIVQSIVEAW